MKSWSYLAVVMLGILAMTTQVQRLIHAQKAPSSEKNMRAIVRYHSDEDPIERTTFLKTHIEVEVITHYQDAFPGAALKVSVKDAETLFKWQGEQQKKKEKSNSPTKFIKEIEFDHSINTPPPRDPQKRKKIFKITSMTNKYAFDNIGLKPDRSAPKTPINIAVLDTGIDREHPDLQGKIQKGTNTGWYGKSENWDDWDGHGTHVSGIIAGTHDQSGIKGIYPHANLYAARVLSPHMSYRSEVIDGLEWVMDDSNHPKIDLVNMSLGGTEEPMRSTSEHLSSYRWTIRKLVEEHNIAVIVAAGNDSEVTRQDQTWHVPAAYPETITVSAVEHGADGSKKDQLAKLSNYGAAVDITAPGVNVMSSVPRQHDIFDEDHSIFSFNQLSGTSMATPHVTGVAALFLARARRQNRKLSPEKLRRALFLQGKFPKTGTWKYINKNKPEPDHMAEPLVNAGRSFKQIPPGSLTLPDHADPPYYQQEDHFHKQINEVISLVRKANKKIQSSSSAKPIQKKIAQKMVKHAGKLSHANHKKDFFEEKNKLYQLLARLLSHRETFLETNPFKPPVRKHVYRAAAAIHELVRTIDLRPFSQSEWRWQVEKIKSTSSLMRDVITLDHGATDKQNKLAHEIDYGLMEYMFVEDKSKKHVLKECQKFIQKAKKLEQTLQQGNGSLDDSALPKVKSVKKALIAFQHKLQNGQIQIPNKSI